jgi:nicotinamide-nucleotide amidase
MESRQIERLAGDVLDAARRAGERIATAESCTGGLVTASLTAIAGSSDVVEGGLVTYSNAAKTALLGVPAALIDAFGAVSEEVARSMAEGALERTGASLAVSVTGIAGPGGGSAGKPVGLVHFATAGRGVPTLCRVERFGDIGRAGVRAASVHVALEMLRARLGAA